MPGINLTPEQDNLRNQIKSLLENITKDVMPHSGKNIDDFEKRAQMFDIMAQKAHELHLSLSAAGNEPKHHKYMIENRGVKADDPEFYRHVHSVEDILAFIENIHANDDPVDQTIGDVFEFKVFSRRWGHYDVYEVMRTETGWEIRRTTADDGTCDKAGRPNLYNAFDHDSINYPEELPGYIEWLWKQANEQGLLHNYVQEALSQLAEWVSICEKNSPRGIFKDFK